MLPRHNESSMARLYCTVEKVENFGASSQSRGIGHGSVFVVRCRSTAAPTFRSTLHERKTCLLVVAGSKPICAAYGRCSPGALVQCGDVVHSPESLLVAERVGCLLTSPTGAGGVASVISMQNPLILGPSPSRRYSGLKGKGSEWFVI